jgi:hypothetical protein
MSSVTRQKYSVGGDASPVSPRASRQGNAVIVGQIDQWIQEGRVFCSSDGDGDDIIAGIAGWVATTPQLVLDFPTGTTGIPLWVNAAQNGTVEAGATGHYTIMYDKIVRLASSGTTETITPFRTDAPNASNATVTSNPTAAAADTARVLYGAQYEMDNGSTGQATEGNLYWSARSHFPPMLVGPASLLVWFDDVASTPNFAWSLGWAEFPTDDIK